MKTLAAIRKRISNAHPEHHAIVRGMAWVALFVFVGKLAGAAKEMTIAYRYGVSDQVDAYLFIFNLISCPVGVWFSILTYVLVPLATRIRQDASACIGYVTPLAKLNGEDVAIFAERKEKLAAARMARKERRLNNVELAVCQPLANAA